MAHAHKVAVVIGSLRKDALSRKLAGALEDLAPSTLEFEEAPIADLPLYNEDLDDGEHVPEAWTAFREQVRASDAVLFVTPEYNRSIPGGLKNAVDVGSRPYGQSAWDGKPGAVASISPGAIGAFGANHHLRQMLVFINVPAMAQPEAYIGGAGELFDEIGNITNESTEQFLTDFMEAFAQWVETGRQ